MTEGGETNLHAHAGSDATWLVVAGQATFYGEGDKVVAKLDKNDMLLIPRGVPLATCGSCFSFICRSYLPHIS